MKRLQIFRPGKHLSADGRDVTITAAQLQAAAEAYDPKLHEAPITIGHPKGSAPAFGWLSKLHFSETGGLEADPIQVDQALTDAIKRGQFKHVSASFYEPDAPQNPKPGVYYIRHLAFLGAQPPAVKGLRQVEFAEGEKGVVEFGDALWASWTIGTAARLFRRLRDAFIAERGVEKADELLPPYDVEALERAAAEESSRAKESPAFSEPEQDMDKNELERREAAIATREQTIAQKEASFAERETRVTAAERAARRQGFVEFLDSLVKEGRFLPVHKDGVVAFMESLPEAGTIEFGEGDKKQAPKTVDFLQGYLKAQPKIVNFDEIAPAKTGVTIDLTDPNAIAAKAVEFKESEAKAGRIISVTEAVAHVTKGVQ